MQAEVITYLILREIQLLPPGASEIIDLKLPANVSCLSFSVRAIGGFVSSCLVLHVQLRPVHALLSQRFEVACVLGGLKCWFYSLLLARLRVLEEGGVICYVGFNQICRLLNIRIHL